MIRDITIGQYYPVESVVHRLDPRTKLFGTLITLFHYFSRTTCSAMQWQPYFWRWRSAPHAYHLNLSCGGLKAIVFLLLISISFNLFLTSGRVIFQIGF